MAGFGFTSIGDFVDNQVFGDIDANEVKENIDYNNEVMSQWMQVLNAQIGNFAGQGLSKQLRNMNGPDIAAARVDDYGGHIGFYTLASFTTAGGGAITGESKRLELAADSEHGIDWRYRYIAVVSTRPTNGAVPGDAQDYLVGVSVELDASPTVLGAQLYAGTNIVLGWTFTEAGLAGNPLTAALVSRMVTLQNTAQLDIYLHACSTASGVFNPGDLLMTFLDDANPRTTPDMAGMIIASPQFITP